MKLKEIAFACISASIWGSSFPVVRLALSSISPILFAFLRYLLASILFLFLILILERRIFKTPKKLKKIALLAFIGVSSPVILQNIGLKYTSAYISGFLQSTGPIYVIILAYIFLNEKITKNKIIGIFLAFSGTYLIASPTGGGDLIGNILILLSAICYSIGGIIAKDLLNEGYKPIQVIAYSSVLGTFFIFPFIFTEKILVEITALKYIIFLAVFPTFIAYILWYSAMEKMEISKLSFFVYLIPIFSIIFSHILLREEMKLLTILAGFVVLVGIAIAQKE